MDLTLSEPQRAVADLAATILGDHCSHERLRARERGDGDRWPRDAWQHLAEAGLLGVGLPERVGGGGFGFCETALLVEATARVAAPLPTFATLVLGAAPIDRFGSDPQCIHWLPAVIDGSRLLTGLLIGARGRLAIDEPPVSATVKGEGFRLDGTAWFVPHAGEAAAFVVPTRLPDGDAVLVVVDSAAPGITTEPLAPMSGEPQSIVRLDGVAIDADAILTGSIGCGGAAVRWMHDRAVAATCIAQAGTCAGALAVTAAYVSTREQFGSKLATFQAVSQRAADAYVDTELVRLTAWSAVWRCSEELDAEDALSIAKVFTAEAGQRVVAAAQHLHGGIGVDLDYPIHRYFRWAKDHEQRLGSGSRHLEALGASIASKKE